MIPCRLETVFSWSKWPASVGGDADADADGDADVVLPMHTSSGLGE